MLPKVEKKFREGPMPGTPQPAPKDAAGDLGPVVGSPDTPEGRHAPDGAPLELSSFVGRGREVSEVEGLLAGARGS